MLTRFQPPAGTRLLLEGLKAQDVVQHDENLAKHLAATGELLSFPSETDIVVQGDASNDVYFILAGEATVFVNGCSVASRREGTCIGEMAAIDPSAPRSATVRARTEVVALKVTESKFREAIDSYPIAYRPLSLLLAKRLRDRSQFHHPPNPQPVVFIGCSTEAINIANEMQFAFKHDKFEPIIWTNQIFGPSGTALESLTKMASTSDFAAFIISPDDTVVSRKQESSAPRDNVIFEMGLFIGRLEPKRVFLIKEQHDDIKIPTDLLGLTLVTYVLKDPKNLPAAIGSVCHEIRKVIKELGPR
jgi:CRP/FNR family cyclic AMP-dependent transcriptional regulator